MKTILLFTLVILAVAISGCQDKKKVRNTNTQKETVKVETKAVLIKDTTQVMETKTATATTVVKEAPEYLLVGGCFRIKDNADRMYDKLHKEGYTNAIIMPYSRDLYLVAYEGKDLAQVLADIHPRFIRFPGGCVAHGDGLKNIYQWKNTVGPLEARKAQRNLWGYHQSMGLGYFEYFQFCEDIGAEPLPVLAAGVPCQNSACHGDLRGGQQGGIPMSEMGAYIQDILDLIEWANGDAKKTKWGKVRAEAGHPKPFNLKYIGIGNEDLITDIFEERFTMIFNAIKEKYPEMIVVGTVGPFNEGTDYVEGWKLADKLGIPMVDEHYYQTPGWFLNNQDFYDKYDRSKKTKVYLGEYATHIPGRKANIETALTEALYLAALERNGDVVHMTSYAPLLAKEGHTQWNPDLIYFNNREVKPTTGYYVQKLYGQNAGNEYLPSKITLDNRDDQVRKRIAASIVRDSASGDVIVKLVNLLPVEVNTNVDLSGIGAIQSSAKRTVLTGKPADTPLPVEDTMEVAEKFDYQLPAYSFTVIRIKKANEK